MSNSKHLIRFSIMEILKRRIFARDLYGYFAFLSVVFFAMFDCTLKTTAHHSIFYGVVNTHTHNLPLKLYEIIL